MYFNGTISGESRVDKDSTIDYSGLLIYKKNFIEIFGKNIDFDVKHLVNISLSNFLVEYFSIDKSNFFIEENIETEEDLFNITNLEYYKNKYIVKILEDGILHLKKLFIEQKISILDIDEKISMIIFAAENKNGFCRYDKESFGDTHFYIDILQVSGVLREANIVKWR